MIIVITVTIAVAVIVVAAGVVAMNAAVTMVSSRTL